MGQDPDAIRQQIEHTRERMGETVDAIGYKADVPSRARDSINERVHGVKSKLSSTGSHVSDAAPGGDDFRQAGRRATGMAQENPLGLAIGALAAGFLGGLMLPSTRLEDERIGPVADQAKEQVRQTGQEAIEHGRELAQETAESVVQYAQEAVPEIKQATQESAQQHAEELRESAQESAQTVRETVQH